MEDSSVLHSHLDKSHRDMRLKAGTMPLCLLSPKVSKITKRGRQGSNKTSSPCVFVCSMCAQARGHLLLAHAQ